MDHAALATTEELDTTIAALKANNFEPETVATGADALARIKELIPPGASVMNGASKTLHQIGYIDYLKEGAHGWRNRHDAILAETDPVKQKELRRHSVVSDFYLGSAHAITDKGEIVIASNTGSQLPHLAFTSPNLILVVSTKKLTPDITSAFDRIDSHIVPLAHEHTKGASSVDAPHAKTLILRRENPMMGRHVHIIFVEEDVGF
jgi:hypothetical protein